MAAFDQDRALHLLAAICQKHGLSQDFSAELISALRDAPEPPDAALGSLGDASAPAWDDDATIDPDAPDPQASAAGSPDAVPAADPTRYQDLGLIGVGGMGEVRRVRDRVLQRVLAMKILRPELRHQARGLARFVEEAQIAAQLGHPGVVSVHDIGRLPDGRLFFTMQEVKGRTFSDVIDELHRGQGSFRRVVDAFHRVCEAVAYAHARGVIHRDLKPSNIMVGTFGRVVVLDWGLARVAASAREDAVATVRAGRSALATVVGSVTGTPAYMAPEQAAGKPAGPPADVYALGAVLYHILAGRSPYMGDALSVLAQVREAAPVAPPAGAIPVPDALQAACARAMAADPAARPAAESLAADVAACLDGAQRRERAEGLVAEADALREELSALQAEAGRLQRQADAARRAVPLHAPIAEKEPLWALETAAAEAAAAVRLQEGAWMQRLQAALTEDPDLPAARDRLADHYHRRHRAAEAALDAPAAAEAAVMLRVHDRGRYAAYLKGDGRLTLLTDPPGATAALLRYEERRRRLEPVFVRTLGRTPLDGVALAMGSYLVRLEKPGFHPLDLPVFIGRNERWENIPPGSWDPEPVRLLPLGSLGPDECYVPAGWFWSGDPEAEGSLPRVRVWADGFVMERYPVTHARFVEFLNALEAQGRSEEAWRLVVQSAADMVVSSTDNFDSSNSSGYHRGEDSRWFLGKDAEGELWLPQWPAFRTSWNGAMAFATWQTEVTGFAWRLPMALEWEKAARGVDGRSFPWGNYFDPAFCRSKHSLQGTMAIATIDETPLDVGPYGVVGMAGNVNTWCLDSPAEPDIVPERLIVRAARPDQPLRWLRGGTAGYTEHWCRAATRLSRPPHQTRDVTGFRLVRSISI